MTGDDSVRAFVALELDAAVRAQLGELQKRLRPRLGDVRFVQPDGIHLTLRFLGQAAPTQVAALETPLAAAAGACPALAARVTGVGTFPDHGSPRVLWLGVLLPEPLLLLQRACERAARGAGFEPELRPYRPHLTLGRWRDRAPRPELPEVDLGEARLETLVLFRSELRQEGARYSSLARFPLAGAEL